MRDGFIRINRDGPDEQTLQTATAVLLDGGVVLYPSDTVYGLLCRADSPDAVSAIRELKGYTGEKPFILIVSGIGMASAMADMNGPGVRQILEDSWPGPVTVVLAG